MPNWQRPGHDRQTPWSERFLEIRLKGKKAGTEARAKAGAEKVANTHPSHPLQAYVGQYDHPAYGVVTVRMKDSGLTFDLHNIKLPLTHFHYDRFDTPDDEQDGMWSLNFTTSPQGDVDRVVMSLEEAEATFTRKPEIVDPKLLAQLAGTYETATGFKFKIDLKEDGSLYFVAPGQPEQELLPYKGLQFRVKEFSDLVFEFVVENGTVKALKQRDPSGEFTFTRK